MAAERYSEEVAKIVIKRAVISPCTKVRNSVAKKQILDDDYLDADTKALIQDFFVNVPRRLYFL